MKQETTYCDCCEKEIEDKVHTIILKLPGSNYREYDLCEDCLSNFESSLKEGRAYILPTTPYPYIPTYPTPEPYPFKPWITYTSDFYGGGTFQ